MENAQLLTGRSREVLSRGWAGVLLKSEQRLAARSILSTNHFKREGAESVAMRWSRLPHSVLALFRTLPCPALFLARSHLVYDRFQLKVASRLEEGEASRLCSVPQRRRPPRNEARRLLNPFILSSVRKNSVKARKYSKMTSWLQAGKGF